MKYISTRGEAPALGFCDAVLAGLATDGGLYVPEEWPAMEPGEIAALAALPYPALASRIVSRFAGAELPEPLLLRLAEEAYATFRHPAVAPLVQAGPNLFVQELFHGPTLAFKDLAMQWLARLMDHILAERGERATVIGATSGDTGGAAIEAFRGRERVDVAILFPDGRVSEVQRRQMTTVAEGNVQAIAFAGTFDDAQALVKAMFSHSAFRRRMNLSGANSINWGRIVAQTAYYFAAGVALGAPHRPVSFTVPTGNFGNVFAGYAARRMGLPIERLVIATNVNDILHRTLATGRYEVRGVEATTSPSMDIQVSSNFERLLFEAEGRDAAAVRRAMAGLNQSGAFQLGPDAHGAIVTHFASGACSEAENRATIARVRSETGLLLDPHSAVAFAVAERAADPMVPMVVLATAHPAKFPDAVEAATGLRPALPARAAGLMERPERYERAPAQLDAVERLIEARSRATVPAG